MGNVNGLTTNDTFLTRDAANTLALRNSTNAQTFNIYNTYTDASNYERGFMKWNANVLEIGTEAGGTGTARGVTLGTASTDLVSLYAATPVAQAAHIADPTGGATTDAEARTAINAILVALENIGITAAA